MWLKLGCKVRRVLIKMNCSSRLFFSCHPDAKSNFVFTIISADFWCSWLWITCFVQCNNGTLFGCFVGIENSVFYIFCCKQDCKQSQSNFPRGVCSLLLNFGWSSSSLQSLRLSKRRRVWWWVREIFQQVFHQPNFWWQDLTMDLHVIYSLLFLPTIIREEDLNYLYVLQAFRKKSWNCTDVVFRAKKIVKQE